MTHVIGIDHGNGNMKTENTEFPCGFEVLDTKPDKVFAKDYIEYNGKFYVLSKERKGYTTNKTEDENAYILTLFSIAKELVARAENGRTNYDFKGVEGKDIVLAIGLPPAHIGKQGKEFKDYFFERTEGTQHSIKFRYNDKPFQLYLKDVLVFPQDYAAAIVYEGDYINDCGECCCVDIGDGTVDVVGLDDGMPEIKKIFSIEDFGMSKLRSRIIASIIKDYGASNTLSDKNMEDYFKGKDIVVQPSKKDAIISKIDSMSKSFTKGLIDELHKNGVNFTTTAIIFSGGGSLALRKYIDELEKEEIISSPRFIDDTKANAIGYQQLAKMQLGIE